MTWRRFEALLRGLGPNSASVSRAAHRRIMDKKGETVRTIEDSKEADKAFAMMFKPPS